MAADFMNNVIYTGSPSHQIEPLSRTAAADLTRILMEYLLISRKITGMILQLSCNRSCFSGNFISLLVTVVLQLLLVSVCLAVTMVNLLPSAISGQRQSWKVSLG